MAWGHAVVREKEAGAAPRGGWRAAHILVFHGEDAAQRGQVCDGVLVELALPQQVPEVLAEDLRRCEPRLQPQAPHNACNKRRVVALCYSSDV